MLSISKMEINRIDVGKTQTIDVFHEQGWWYRNINKASIRIGAVSNDGRVKRVFRPVWRRVPQNIGVEDLVPRNNNIHALAGALFKEGEYTVVEDSKVDVGSHASKGKSREGQGLPFLSLWISSWRTHGLLCAGVASMRLEDNRHWWTD